MPGKVLAPTEDHTTLAVAPALESLGRCGTVAFVGGGGRGLHCGLLEGLRAGWRGKGRRHLSDCDGHVVVSRVVGELVVVVVVYGVQGVISSRGLFAVHLSVEDTNLKGRRAWPQLSRSGTPTTTYTHKISLVEIK